MVYRPGSKAVTASFFDELATLLERLSVLQSPTSVVGNFNIRLDRVDDHHAVTLRSVFNAYGFSVSSSGPTHRQGGTLDVVAARSPVQLSVIDDDFSDHRLLWWPVALDISNAPSFHARHRSWRHLDLA